LSSGKLNFVAQGKKLICPYCGEEVNKEETQEIIKFIQEHQSTLLRTRYQSLLIIFPMCSSVKRSIFIYFKQNPQGYILRGK